MLVILHNPGAEADHWVVVYGYGRKPDRVYLATNSLPWFTPNRMGRTQFERIWQPSGFGLVCSKRSGRFRAR